MVSVFGFYFIILISFTFVWKKKFVESLLEVCS